MLFLSVNHLRLGAQTGGIPPHLATEMPAFSSRDVLDSAAELAINHKLHAVMLTGEILAPTNAGLEAHGALRDTFHRLHRAGIPVVAVSDGHFTPQLAESLNVANTVTFVHDHLDWHPPIVTGTDPVEGGAIHIIDAAVAEESDSPHVLELGALDQPGSIWLLTAPSQPDSLRTEHALVIEPGSPLPLSSSQINRHGVWLVDTDSQDATLIPIAPIEFASIDVDLTDAQNLDDAERLIIDALTEAADIARADSSAAQHLLVDVTLVGATRLYPSLPDLADELTRLLQIEHSDLRIALTDVHIDATPAIDLEPLLQRPDPLGELARLIDMLASDAERTPAQQAMIAAAEQRLLAVTHARVFGSIHDTDLEPGTETLLTRSAWAMLDTLVRQRGIDR